MYGTASDSPLQTLEHFDIAEQLSPDVMHDILEGGIEFVIRHVLGGLVGDQVIRKQDLERIQFTKYGFHDKKATPLTVAIAFLNGKASMRGDELATNGACFVCFPRYMLKFYLKAILTGTCPWHADTSLTLFWQRKSQEAVCHIYR
ncbi:hypothetical protein MRX96_002232 [Rhipicephalus microplus]